MKLFRNKVSAAAEYVLPAVYFLREWLFPIGCGICGGVLAGMEETWYGLCGNCRGKIEPPRSCDCDRCGKPLISEIGRCLSCRRLEESGEKSAVDRMAVLFPYVGKYRRLLLAYKFGKNVALGHFFAENIRKLANRLAPEDSSAVIVPVPPRHGKIWKTGWDQIEHLAKLLESGRPSQTGATASPLAVSRCLRRLPSGAQKALNREDRRRNLQGKIQTTRPAPQTAILIDDVITTGSTMDACAGALKAGGAQRVFGICLFYD